MAIEIPGKIGFRILKLDTRELEQIDNCQTDFISLGEVSEFDKMRSQFINITERNEPTAIYNCHGMTFASKRTAISSSQEISKILNHDKYVQIPRTQALAGDVILYKSSEGDFEHSGILLTNPRDSEFGVPLVLSKWGKFSEIIHLENNCPYSQFKKEYYRIKL